MRSGEKQCAFAPVERRRFRLDCTVCCADGPDERTEEGEEEGSQEVEKQEESPFSIARLSNLSLSLSLSLSPSLSLSLLPSYHTRPTECLRAPKVERGITAGGDRCNAAAAAACDAAASPRAHP